MYSNRNRAGMPGGWSPRSILRDLWITWRLLRDPQVSFFLKLLLPILALVYWVLPIDLLPGMPFDDVAILILATHLFVQMAPPDAVRRAMGRFQEGGDHNDDAIDTTWKIVDD